MVLVNEFLGDQGQGTNIDFLGFQRASAHCIGARQDSVHKLLLHALSADHALQNVGTCASAGTSRLAKLLLVQSVCRLQDAQNLVGDIIRENGHGVCPGSGVAGVRIRCQRCRL